MFSVGHRENVRRRLVERAECDARVIAAAVTGSAAHQTEDHWSDIDLFFGVSGGTISSVLDDWTSFLYRELGAIHHFDLIAGPATYRAFLLENLLEVDLGFTPVSAFGPVGNGAFDVLFGEPAARKSALFDADHLIGRCWHHVLHAHVCIQRSSPWQAEYWISALRDNTLTLMADRFGYPGDYLRGADHLPMSSCASIQDSLVQGLDAAELSRALTAVTRAFITELGHRNTDLAHTLAPRLLALSGN